jgi:hypothetical protein
VQQEDQVMTPDEDKVLHIAAKAVTIYCIYRLMARFPFTSAITIVCLVILGSLPRDWSDVIIGIIGYSVMTVVVVGFIIILVVQLSVWSEEGRTSIKVTPVAVKAPVAIKATPTIRPSGNQSAQIRLVATQEWERLRPDHS